MTVHEICNYTRWDAAPLTNDIFVTLYLAPRHRIYMTQNVDAKTFMAREVKVHLDPLST